MGSLRIVAAAGAALLLVAAGATPALASDTKSVAGPFSSVLVPPPGCQSPVGICTLGHLSGDLDATYAFTMETLVPLGNPAYPNRFLYTGESVITIIHGGAVMLSHDTGFIDFEGTENPFVTTVNIYTGTKQYSDATGTLVASGQLNFVTGNAVGSYTGTIDK